MGEVLVGGQQRERVANAELREQRIDGADLDTGTAAAIARLGRVDVVLAVGRVKGPGAEPVDDVLPCARPGVGGGATTDREASLKKTAAGLPRRRSRDGGGGDNHIVL